MLPPFVWRGLVAWAVSVLLLASTTSAQDEPTGELDSAGEAGAPPDSAGALDEPEVAADSAEPADDSDEDVPAEDRVDADGRLERLKVHAAGLGYHALVFRSKEGDGYTLQGPAASYDYFVGRHIGFAIRGVAFLPAYGRYSGQADFRGPLWGMYADRHSGFDLTLMIAVRTRLSEDLSLFAGVGLHAQATTVNGAAYRIVELITMGAGANVRLQWEIHRLVMLHAGAHLAIDPFDMIDHNDPAVFTLPIGGTFGIGVRY